MKTWLALQRPPVDMSWMKNVIHNFGTMRIKKLIGISLTLWSSVDSNKHEDRLHIWQGTWKRHPRGCNRSWKEIIPWKSSVHYSARAQDGPQEMERNEAAAKHVACPSCAWLLLNFFPYHVGHPEHKHCKGMVKKVDPRLRELAPTDRGSQKEGSCNLVFTFLNSSVHVICMTYGIRHAHWGGQ